MISIVSVVYNSADWAELLVESVRRYSDELPEMVLVDNSRPKIKSVHGVELLENHGDPTHGAGLNLGVAAAKCDHVLLLDVDCHILRESWEATLLGGLGDGYALAVPGSTAKPIRPACLLMKAADARNYDWRATEGYMGHRVTPGGYDVGIAAYHAMVAEGRSLRWMTVKKDNRYGTLNGEEYGVGRDMVCYHNWHGAHLKERQVDYRQDLMADKDKLFEGIPWRRPAKFS